MTPMTDRDITVIITGQNNDVGHTAQACFLSLSHLKNTLAITETNSKSAH